MAGSSLSKALLRNLDTNEEIPVQFNPTEYSFQKQLGWKEADTGGADVPKSTFTGGKPIQLTLKLFFDTQDTGEDVRKKYINKIWNLALVTPGKKDPKTKKGRPPVVQFTWGEVWTFKAVVTQISSNFTLFDVHGVPVRATCDIGLKQVEDPKSYPFQNPTSGGVAGHRTHVVEQAERLDVIAAREYGEAEHWRHIARANGIEDPIRVRAGTVLSLPPLPGA
jgi:nucleoid-associated protein YgaU